MVDVAEAWWEESRAWEDRMASVSEEILLLLKRMHCKDFLAGLSEAESAAAAAERLRDKEMQRACRLRNQGHHSGPMMLEALARIVDFNPKQRGLYYPQYTLFDPATFDLDEESPFGPMRYTDALYKSEHDYHYLLCGAVNLLSVKIACLDVGLPIRVHGTVIVRDSVDERCVYNFRRHGDHCQLINSEAESLILTGPKRGLALLGDIYVETDLQQRT